MSYSPPPAGLAVQACVFARPWRWSERLVAVACGGVLLALLATAACLRPSRDGLGTHQQLGLPPCTVLDWFGVRCPSCGMTTSWAHMARGDVTSAVRANAGGALLAALAAACGPWLVASGLLGRWLVVQPPEKLILGVGLAVVATTLTQWTLRLSLGW